LVVTGNYSGKDVYIQNPNKIIGKDTLWTAQKVFVNDQLIFTEKQLQTTAFAIPLTKLGFKNGDKIILKIIQIKINRVKILNP